ncbi:MAG: PBP1A family penicillin-binding protein [Pseudomonadota bacterium]|nr:PBP1A family penicillin-binding protein [Pseudomonadota bacterium]
MPQNVKTKIRRNLKKGLVVLENTVRKTKKKNTTAKKSGPRKTRTNRKKKGNFSLWKSLFVLGLWLALLLCIFIGAYVLYCYATLPDINKAVAQTRQPSTTIMAENGSDIASFGNIYAEVIYPDKLPKNLTDAIISTEDHRFYSHFGFDVWGFGRAIVTNIFRGRYAQGASTITQQVAKNIFLTPNKNIKRKVQELLLAFWLENKLTKNQIMALYLNRVYFGSGTYGAEAAANWYFNKSVYDLNLREAAILAGMLKAPNRYNPILKRDNALKRANAVLHNMLEYGYITNKQYAAAKTLPVSNGQQYRVSGGKHFAQYVYDEVNGYIGERSVDINVMTTLDQKLQESAEKILRRHLEKAKSKNVSEGAVVIMDYQGAVKAMVGGTDYNRSQFNRAVQAIRQPGSAFKPFVYLTALQYGFAPDSIVNDAPLTIGKWQPANYSKRYYGNVTLDYALSHSLNVATAALSRELYLKDIAANAHKMGISTNISLTPSMVLGTNGVKVIDMAAAYTVLANGGYAVWPHAINEITTKDGHQLYVRQNDTSKQILSSDIVRQMTQMLNHVITRGTGKKAQLPYFSAGKTGTTQNYRDAWFAGWAGGYVAVVWVGNDNEKPMNGVGGGTVPAEIWHDVMLTAHQIKPLDTTDEIGRLIDDNDTGQDSIGALIDQENLEDSAKETPSTLEDLLNTIF